MENHRVDALAVETAAEAAAFEAGPVAVHGPGPWERHPSLCASFPHSYGLPQSVANSNPGQVLQCPHLRNGYKEENEEESRDIVFVNAQFPV